MIATQINTGVEFGSAIETMDDKISARVYLLNGCSQMSKIDLQSNTMISVTGVSWTGKAKLMLLDCNHHVTFFKTISQETDTITVLPGNYQVVVVGYWFSGSVLLEISKE